MQAIIKTRLDELQATRERTLNLVKHLSQAQSEFAPAPRKWSIGEILDHLIRAERLYREKFAELIDMAKSGRPAVLRVRFAEVNTSIAFIPKPLLGLMEAPLGVLNSVMPKCIRETFVQYRLVPAQAPSVAEPTRGRALQELRDELRNALAEMNALFAANAELNFTQMRVIHPLMGDNNIPELLKFIASHEQRHQNQLLDILNLSEFPAAVAADMATAT